MLRARALLPLTALGCTLTAGPAAAQSIYPPPPPPWTPAQPPERSPIVAGGGPATTEPVAPVAVGTRPYGPGYGYGVTYFGWPVVPYYGGVAYGPAFSGLGVYGLSSRYGNAGYGLTGPPQEAAIREELRRQQAEQKAAAGPRARLALVFPARAEVWLDGKAVPGNESEWVLTSGPLEEGQSHTFAVKARWTVAGQQYEWERTANVTAGEKGRVVVFGGTPVKPPAPKPKEPEQQ